MANLPKKGDKVKIVKGFNGHGYAEGTVVTLLEDAHPTRLFNVQDDTGHIQVVDLEDIDIQPINKEKGEGNMEIGEIVEFKGKKYEIVGGEISIGDKVIVVDNTNKKGDEHRAEIGDVGTVERISHGSLSNNPDRGRYAVRIGEGFFGIWHMEFEDVMKVKEIGATDGSAAETSNDRPFEIGEKVVLLSGGGWFPLFGFENGETYTVKAYPGDEDYRAKPGGVHYRDNLIMIVDEVDRPGYAPASALRKASEAESSESDDTLDYKPAEKEKVKAGDTLILRKDVDIPFITVGKEYEVVDIDFAGDPQIIDDDGEKLDTAGCLDAFEHVPTTEEAQPSHTFKVGDKVRVITDNPVYGWGAVSKADVGEIFRIDGDIIRVNFPSQSWWNGRADEFELVTEDTEAVKTETRFLVGDIVTGKPEASDEYCITTSEMTRGLVTEVYSNEMKVQVLEHTKYPHEVGSKYTVEMKYFKHVEGAENVKSLAERLVISLTDEQKEMLRELLA